MSKAPTDSVPGVHKKPKLERSTTEHFSAPRLARSISVRVNPSTVTAASISQTSFRSSARLYRRMLADSDQRSLYVEYRNSWTRMKKQSAKPKNFQGLAQHVSHIILQLNHHDITVCLGPCTWLPRGGLITMDSCNRRH
jgi:hypothetical protein